MESRTCRKGLHHLDLTGVYIDRKGSPHCRQCAIDRAKRSQARLRNAGKRDKVPDPIILATRIFGLHDLLERSDRSQRATIQGELRKIVPYNYAE